MGNSPYLQHPGRPWASLGDVQFLASGQMVEPLGLLYMPFLRVQFPKSYPLLLMPTWGPQMSVHRSTLWKATAVTKGVGTLDISQYHFLAPGQPLATSGVQPWPPRGPPHVGLPSSLT